MAAQHQIRDSSLLDALGSVSIRTLKKTLWRIVRKDRDPIRSSSPKGRWDDGTIDVLYTSLEADGAKAEMHFHLSRGQPVFPSKMEFLLFEIEVELLRALDLTDRIFLETLGIDPITYGKLGYQRREDEYRPSQRIGEAAQFLDSDAIIVPNARWTCNNAILFASKIPPDRISVVRDHGLVDWTMWQRRETLSN